MRFGSFLTFSADLHVFYRIKQVTINPPLYSGHHARNRAQTTKCDTFGKWACKDAPITAAQEPFYKDVIRESCLRVSLPPPSRGVSGLLGAS